MPFKKGQIPWNKGKKWSKGEKRKFKTDIVRRYKMGESGTEIAKDEDCSYKAIYRWLKKFGVTLRPPQNKLRLAGKRFGRLVAIKGTEERESRSVIWECQCDCGNMVYVSSHSLMRGATKSCGCLHKDIISLPSGEAIFNSLLASYRQSAKKRKYLWKLSDKKVRELFGGNCHYCGTPPSTINRSRSRGSFSYNGIDRVDNDKGYIPNNCVSCCKLCNRMKSSYPLKKFNQQIKRIYKHLYET